MNNYKSGFSPQKSLLLFIQIVHKKATKTISLNHFLKLSISFAVVSISSLDPESVVFSHYVHNLYPVSHAYCDRNTKTTSPPSVHSNIFHKLM